MEQDGNQDQDHFLTRFLGKVSTGSGRNLVNQALLYSLVRGQLSSNGYYGMGMVRLAGEGEWLQLPLVVCSRYVTLPGSQLG